MLLSGSLLVVGLLLGPGFRLRYRDGKGFRLRSGLNTWRKRGRSAGPFEVLADGFQGEGVFGNGAARVQDFFRLGVGEGKQSVIVGSRVAARGFAQDQAPTFRQSAQAVGLYFRVFHGGASFRFEL